MNKKYVTLFTEIAHSMELISEQALEFDEKKNDHKGAEAATTMREDYANLYNKMRDENFDSVTLTRAEFAKLLVGAIVVSQNLKNQVKKIEKAAQGYKIDVIPKLERIVNETDNNDDALKLANELFQIINTDE